MSASSGDLAVSLPVDTTTFTATSMMPVGLVDSRHLLGLADDVAVEEIEALALSLDEHAGWVGASRLQLSPGAELHGPWPLDDDMRRMLALPDWAAQVMLLECAPQRAGALPPELAGVDPMADAFPTAMPTGAELVALIHLRAIARRLAGAIRLVDTSPDDGEARITLVVPDPESSVMLAIYAPVWIAPDALAVLLDPIAPGAVPALETSAPSGPVGFDALSHADLERLTETIGADVLDEVWRDTERERARAEREEAAALAAGEELVEYREGYAVVAPIDAGAPGWGGIEVRVEGTNELPIAVQGEPWVADGVVVTSVVWRPLDIADAHALTPSRTRRRERAAARELIEQVAATVARESGGVIVDEDGFLVGLDIL